MKKRKKLPLYLKLLITALGVFALAYLISKCGYIIIEVP